MVLVMLLIMLCLLLLVQLVAAKHVLITPAIVCTSSWILCVIVALANFKSWNTDISVVTAVLIFGTVIAFGLGDSLASRTRVIRSRTNTLSNDVRPNSIIMISTGVTLFFALLSIIVLYSQLDYIKKVALLAGYNGNLFGVFGAARRMLNSSVNTISYSSIYSYLGVVVKAFNYVVIYVIIKDAASKKELRRHVLYLFRLKY